MLIISWIFQAENFIIHARSSEALREEATNSG